VALFFTNLSGYNYRKYNNSSLKYLVCFLLKAFVFIAIKQTVQVSDTTGDATYSNACYKKKALNKTPRAYIQTPHQKNLSQRKVNTCVKAQVIHIAIIKFFIRNIIIICANTKT